MTTMEYPLHATTSNLWLKEVEFEPSQNKGSSCNAILKDKYRLLVPDKSKTTASSTSSISTLPLKPVESNRNDGNKAFNATFPELVKSPPQSNGVINHVKDPHVGSGDGPKSPIIKSPSLASTTPLTDISKPKHTIDYPDNLNLDWIIRRQIGPGLVNLGNTCFMNSVIQCLTYCPPLVHALINGKHTEKCASTGSCMACVFENHFKGVFNQKIPVVINPKPFATKLKLVSKNFNWGRQEDAHEYLRHVIDNMCRMAVVTAEYAKNKSSFGTPFKFDPRSKETTVFNHIFGGYLRSQITCLSCKSTSNTFDHFMDLMLDIKNVDTLDRALLKFTSSERLDSENSYKCTNCKKKSEATKRFTIHLPPNVLTVQLKRFEYNRSFGKITRHVNFTEELNLRRFMSDPSSPSSNVVYKLFAVLVHTGGSCNSGHYYCYVRNSNELWYRMDDDSVSKSGLNHVLSQNAYILFYVKKSSVNPMVTAPNPISRMNGVNSTSLNGSKNIVSGSLSKGILSNSSLTNGSRPNPIGQTSNKFIGPVLPSTKPMLSDPSNSPVKKIANFKTNSTASSIVVVKSNGNRPAIISEKPRLKLNNGDISVNTSQISNSSLPSKIESNKRLVEYSDGSDTDEPAAKKMKSSPETQNNSTEKDEIRLFSNSSSSNSVSSLSEHSSHSSKDNSPKDEENNGLITTEPQSSGYRAIPTMNGSNTVITKDIIHKSSNFEPEINGNSLLSYGSNVKSWNGKLNSIDEKVQQSQAEEMEANREEDEYNEEIDTGKTKKVKPRLGEGIFFPGPNVKNPFDFYSKPNGNYNKSNYENQSKGPFSTHRNYSSNNCRKNGYNGHSFKGQNYRGGYKSNPYNNNNNRNYKNNGYNNRR